MDITFREKEYKSRDVVILPYSIVRKILDNIEHDLELNIINLLITMQKEIVDLIIINFPEMDKNTVRRLTMEDLTNIAALLFNESMKQISEKLTEKQDRQLSINCYINGYDNEPTTFSTEYISLTLGVIEDITELYEELNNKNSAELMKNLPVETIKTLLEDLEDLILNTFDGLTLLALDTANVIDLIKAFKNSFLYGTSLLSSLGESNQKN